MKKMFTDILRNNIAHGVDSKNIWNTFNKKGITRSPRYYDDDLLSYFADEVDSEADNIKNIARDVLLREERFEKLFIFMADNLIWYAINMQQIQQSIDESLNHFVICNNVSIIDKLINKHPNKCRVIKVSVENNNIIGSFEHLYKKYSELNQGNEADMDIEERTKKATNIITYEQDTTVRDTFTKLKKEGVLEYIIISDDTDTDRMEENFQNDLLKVLDKYSRRFDWKRLLSTRKIFDSNYKVEVFKKNSESDEKKSLLDPFILDYNSISALSSFRRMQDKCQVFPLKRYDYARTRLTHSLEVAAIAESLGESAVRYIRDIVPQDYDRICRGIPIILRNAALLHDMGNPPFGHFSEDAIRLWFKNNMKYIRITNESAAFDDSELNPPQYMLSADMQNDLLYYEGNAQLFRLLTILADIREVLDEDTYPISPDGKKIDLNFPDLTMASIAATIKYPTSATELISAKEEEKKDKENKDICRKKNGYFITEKKYFDLIDKKLGLKGRRHPLTFLLEAADDIAYCASDIEDALKKRVISFDDILHETDAIISKGNNVIVKLRILVDDRLTTDNRKKIKNKLDELVKLDKSMSNESLFENLEINYETVEKYRKSIVKIKELKKLLEDWKEKINGIEQPIRLVTSELAFKALRTHIADSLLECVKEAFRNNYDKIMSCEKKSCLKNELLDVSDAGWMKILLKRILVKYVYHSDELVKNQLKAAKVVDTILSAFVKAAIKMGYNTKVFDVGKPEDNPENITDWNVFLSFSENYRLICKRKNEIIDKRVQDGKLNQEEANQQKVFNCLLLAMDVFAGMTDSFAMEMYHLLTASK